MIIISTKELQILYILGWIAMKGSPKKPWSWKARPSLVVSNCILLTQRAQHWGKRKII